MLKLVVLLVVGPSPSRMFDEFHAHAVPTWRTTLLRQPMQRQQLWKRQRRCLLCALARLRAALEAVKPNNKQLHRLIMSRRGLLLCIVCCFVVCCFLLSCMRVSANNAAQTHKSCMCTRTFSRVALLLHSNLSLLLSQNTVLP